MDEVKIVNVYDVVGSEFCISSEDGEKVHSEIVGELRKNQKVAVSFEKVEDLTSAFLNVAIGQLYGEFDENHVRTYLSIANLAREDFGLLKRVVDGAKEYFKDPQTYDMVVRQELGGEID